MALLREASSDSDTISITLSQVSEAQEEYALERILAESEEQTHEKQYLVKWEGYPERRSTWEPVESFGDDSTILQDWEDQKMRVRRGLVKEFDLKAFYKEQTDYLDRRKRKIAKRKRLGLTGARDTTDSNSEVETGSEEDKSTRTGDGAVRRRKTRRSGYGTSDERKVVARQDKSDVQDKAGKPSHRKRRRVLESEDESSNYSDDSGMGKGQISQFDRAVRDPAKKEASIGTEQIAMSSTAATRSRLPSRGRILTKATKAIPAATTTQTSTPAATLRRHSVSTPSSLPIVGTRREGLNDVTKTHSRMGIAGTGPQRANKPTSTAAKKTDLGARILGNWASDVKPRQRTRINRETANRPEEKTFVNLSQQRRFQLFGRNEPAPTRPLHLTTLVGHTASQRSGSGTNADTLALGKTTVTTDDDEPPKQPALADTLDSKTTTDNGHIAESAPRVRAVGFADERRQRKEVVKPTIDESDQKSMSPPLRDKRRVPVPANEVEERIFQPGKKSPHTCPHWSRGSCRLSAAGCGYQHHHTGTTAADIKLPKHATPPLTCWYWRTASCKLSDDACKYAHWDTGHWAGKNGTEIIPLQMAKETPELAPPAGPRIDNNAGLVRSGSSTAASDRPKPLDLKSKECWFWATRGWCTKTDEQCAFAHYHTGITAEPSRPGKFGARTYSASSDFTSHKVAFSPGNETASPSVETHSSDLPGKIPQMRRVSPKNAPNPQPAVKMRLPEQTARTDADIVSIRLVINGTYKDHPVEFQVGLAFSDDPARSRFLNMAGPTQTLNIESLCLAEDFRLCKYDKQASGHILPDTHSPQAKLTAFSEDLKLRAAGAVASTSGFTLLVHPANQDVWSFVEEESSTSVPDALLRFHVLSPLENTAGTILNFSTIEVKEHSLSSVIHNFLGIDAESLLISENNEDVRKVVFIMFPLNHQDEVDLIVEFLHAQEFKVYLGREPGSWAYFLSKYTTGIVLIHATICEYWQIPRFTSVLKKGFNVFQLGVHADGGYKCTRMFPSGRVVFITDDVLANHPREALSVLTKFEEQMAKRPQGSWKVAGRPDLKMWLLELAEKPVQDESKRKLRQELYIVFKKLVPLRLTVSSDPDRPSNYAPVLPLSSKELPRHAHLWEQNPKEASNSMVNWFAGWACKNALRFKRFIVVHPWHNDEWASSYKHVEFTTPSDYGKLTQGM